MNKLLKTALVPLLLIMSLGITLLAFNADAVSKSVKPDKATNDSAETTYRAAKPRAQITLSSVGTRYVRASIPIKGYLSGNSEKLNKHLLLQVFNGHRWVTKRSKYQRKLGKYSLGTIIPTSPRSSLKIRTLVFYKKKLLGKSHIISVKVIRRPVPATPPNCDNAPSPTTCPKPAATGRVENQTVDGTKTCQRLVIDVLSQRRTFSWVWSDTAKKWVEQPNPWETVSSTPRAAVKSDCLTVLPGVPAGVSYPDIRIKSLVKCGLADSTATGGTCFKIVYPTKDDTSPDYSYLFGHKMLKFGLITLNLGAGPAEIIADRSSPDPNAWSAYQTFYGSDGTRLGSVTDPGVQFIWGKDGHDHWHVKDFDSYEILDQTGQVLKTAEKHGYCLQDNTTYGPWEGLPGVPPDDDTPGTADKQGVYWETTSCGKNNESALSIVHGLSKGWGDTYPTSLPDQGVDITGLPNGRYTIRVYADKQDAIKEGTGGEGNNVAQVQVDIVGDTVAVVCGTWSGAPDDPAVTDTSVPCNAGGPPVPPVTAPPTTAPPTTAPPTTAPPTTAPPTTMPPSTAPPTTAPPTTAPPTTAPPTSEPPTTAPPTTEPPTTAPPTTEPPTTSPIRRR